MMRLTIFIIAVLLAVGAIDPTGPWLVTLAVLSGIVAFRGGRFRLGGPGRWAWRWSREFDW